MKKLNFYVYRKFAIFDINKVIIYQNTVHLHLVTTIGWSQKCIKNKNKTNKQKKKKKTQLSFAKKLI